MPQPFRSAPRVLPAASPGSIVSASLAFVTLALVLASPAHAQPDDASIDAELEALEAEFDGERDADDSAAAEHDSDPLDDELERMERELDQGISTPSSPPPSQPTQRAAIAPAQLAQSMNPDISLIADFALAWFSDEPTLLGGHDATDMGFNLQGLELGLAAGIDPYWRFDSHILISLFGLEVEEAYATTLALPFGLQARAGQFLTNFGRVNPTHLHAWNFTTQPLVNGKFFGGEGLRGLGVEVGQLVPLPWLARWTLSAQNIAGGATGRSFLASSDELEALTDLSVALRLEQFWDIGERGGMLLGLSAANGPNSSGRGNRSDIYGADLLLKRTTTSARGRSELGWQSEVMVRRRQDPGPADSETGAVLQDWGGYTELFYSPSLFWKVAARYERVHGVANDPLDPRWEEPRQRASLSMSYLPSHFSRLRLEYALDHLPEAATPMVHMAFLQLDLVAGAHGSHRY